MAITVNIQMKIIFYVFCKILVLDLRGFVIRHDKLWYKILRKFESKIIIAISNSRSQECKFSLDWQF